MDVRNIYILTLTEPMISMKINKYVQLKGEYIAKK